MWTLTFQVIVLFFFNKLLNRCHFNVWVRKIELLQLEKVPIFARYKEKRLTQITHGCPSWYQYLKWWLE